MTVPAISVLIPVHDRKKYLPFALESIIRQTLIREKFEVIVVKNFIDSEIEQIIESKGYRFINTSKDPVGAKFSLGISECKGEIVVFMDDDDEFSQEKLEKVLKVFNEHPDALFLHNSHDMIDEEENIIETSLRAIPESDIVFDISSLTARNFWKLYRYGPDFNSSSICLKKSLAIKHLDLLSRINSAADLFNFISCLSEKGEVIVLKDKLTHYRVHESMTHSGNEGTILVEGSPLNSYFRRHVSDNSVMLEIPNLSKLGRTIILINRAENALKLNMTNLPGMDKVRVLSLPYLIRGAGIFKQRYLLGYAGVLIASRISYRFARTLAFKLGLSQERNYQ